MVIKRFNNPRKQGDAGLGQAIAWFTSQGWTVCVPLTDSQDFDLVVLETPDEPLLRVQVKTSTQERRSGVFRVQLATKGGNKSGGSVKLFDSSKSDLLFISCSDGSDYVIPSEHGQGKTEIIVGGAKYDSYRV